MLTSRITEGEHHYFLVTLMVISVCFSWALDTYIFSFRFCLAVVTEL